MLYLGLFVVITTLLLIKYFPCKQTMLPLLLRWVRITMYTTLLYELIHYAGKNFLTVRYALYLMVK